MTRQHQARGSGGGQAKDPPVHTVRIGAVKAAVWANDTAAGVVYTVSFERLYKPEGGRWSSSHSFGRDDLLVLRKVADWSHNWILRAQSDNQREAE